MHKLFSKFGAALGLIAVVGCTNAQVAKVTSEASAVIKDAGTVVIDMQQAEQQIASSGSVPAAALTDINSSIALVQSDISLVSSSGTAANINKVLTDVDTAVNKLAPYSPIIAEFAMVGTNTVTARRYGAVAAPVTVRTGSAVVADVAALRAHAGR